MKAPPQTAVADLKFPVIFIQDGILAIPKSSADELMVLHSNLLNMNLDVGKTIIDSDFRIYKVTHLRSTRSSLGQMMNPVGLTPVVFDLTAAGQGLEPARAALLACKYLAERDEDIKRKHDSIAKQTTLAGMIAVIQSYEPDTRPAPTDDPASNE